MLSDNEDIAISFIEMECEKAFINIEELMAEIDNTELNNTLIFPHMLNYDENYTVKKLFLICEYYGFAKELKNNKYNKEQIINWLVMFESDPKNSDIVSKRQNMWFYMNELKNDKFMKKFVLW